MLSERKRFNYLPNQQRVMNSSSAQEKDKLKQNLIQSFNNKTYQHSEQYQSIVNYSLITRNSIKKNSLQLNQPSQNILCFPLQFKSQTTKGLALSNKQNISLRLLLKDQKPHLKDDKSSSELCLQAKVKQLQEQHTLLLKSTEEKFLQMQIHLEKVQNILKQKQKIIESLTTQNAHLKDENFSLEKKSIQFEDQKQKLLKTISFKNQEIKQIMLQKQKNTQRQSQLLEQLNQMTLQQKIKTISLIKTIQTAQKTTQTAQTQTEFVQLKRPNSAKKSLQKKSNFFTQTQLLGQEIEIIEKKRQQIQEADHFNYREKYESLFKKALEMEDEIYQLKQQLFDSQSQVKTLEQEFNTYKILNQIEKINQKL